jgi:hypothetical protein
VEHKREVPPWVQVVAALFHEPELTVAGALRRLVVYGLSVGVLVGIIVVELRK